MKVKYTLVQALRLCTGRTAHRGSTGIPLLFLDHGTRRGQRQVPAAFYARKRPGLGRPQGRSWQVRKISPPPGFDLRTVQPVACRYTDYKGYGYIGYILRLHDRRTRGIDLQNSEEASSLKRRYRHWVPEMLHTVGKKTGQVYCFQWRVFWRGLSVFFCSKCK